MLDIVRTSLRLMTHAFDAEIQVLIDAALAELQMLGVSTTNAEDDPQLKLTVIAYCKWQFGDNSEKERWAGIYRDKLAMLKTSSLYQSEVSE